MAQQADIKSVHGGTLMRFSRRIGLVSNADPESFVVTVIGINLSASAKVEAFMNTGLVEFFAGMAAEWRGWAGEKTFKTLEDELVLKATSTSTGHVRINYELRTGYDEYAWCVTGTLHLEAGQLEQVAHDITGFWTGQTA